MKKIEEKQVQASIDSVAKHYIERTMPGWKVERFRILAVEPPVFVFDLYRLVEQEPA